MPNPLQRFIDHRFVQPAIDARLADLHRSQRSFAQGAIALPEFTLRESIGQPTDTDHALLYAVYKMHVDVNACVQKWVSGITAGDWHLGAMEPDEDVPAGLQAIIDETETWLKNPNPHKPMSILLAELVQHLAIAGDAFWHVSRQGNKPTGRPLEIWPLHPATMQVQADEHGAITGYVQRSMTGQDVTFEAWEVLHFRLPNPTNDLYGESPLSSALEDIGLDLQAMRSNRAIFANGFKPSAFVVLDNDLNVEEQKAVATQLKALHTGSSNQHKLVISPGIKDVKPWAQTLKDMEFTAQRELSTKKVTTAYRIPMVLLGYHNAGDYASTEILKREVHESTFRPNRLYISQKITEALLHTIDPRMAMTFNQPDFSNPESRRTDLLAARKDQTVTRNEVRTIGFGLEPIDKLDEREDLLGEQGDEDPDDTEAEAEPTPTDETTDQDTAQRTHKRYSANEIEEIRVRRDEQLAALEAAFLPSVQTFFQAQETRYRDRLTTTFKGVALGSGLTRVHKGVIDDLADRYVEGTDGDTELGIQFFADLETPAQAGADEAQLQIGFTLNTDVVRQVVDEYLLRNALTHAKGINETTRGQLRDELRTGIGAGEGIPELRERVKSVFTEATTNRATIIARTETAQAFEAVNLAAMQESGLDLDEQWLTAKDDRVRPEHRLREGLVVRLGSDWGGIRPGQEINCIVEGQEVLALDVRKKFRAKYSGPVIRFATHSGAGLTVTMNHPMLTGRGWIPASQVKKGDNFVNASSFNEEVSFAELDVHPVKSLVEDVLVSKGRVVSRVPVAATDFHGDGAACEYVDVVGSSSGLGTSRNAGVDDGIEQSELIGTAFGKSSFVGDSTEQFAAPGISRTSASSMGSDGVSHALLRASGSSKNPIGIRTIANLDSLASEPTTKSDAGDANILGKLVDRSAGLVSLDEVIDIECVRDFNGHVYDLETDHGWYICNNIITHNCRCTSIGVVKEDL